jgi:hypothetical protein
MVPQLQISDKKTGSLIKTLSCQVSPLGHYGYLSGVLTGKPVQAREHERLPEALASEFIADSD